MKMKHELKGYIDYPGVGEITDEQVYQLIKKHSRLIDRLSPRKMVEMAIGGQLILCGIFEDNGWYANQNDWMFYGKDGFYTYVNNEEPLYKSGGDISYKDIR